MTNREKYINNASNEELAKILAHSLDRCSFCCLTPEICDGCISQCEKRIAYWLSQEVEEDIVSIPNIGKMPKTDKIAFDDYENFDEVKITVKAWNEVIDKVRELNIRLDKLEKCNRIAEVKEHIEESLKEKTKDIVKNKNIQPMTKEDAEELVNKISLCAEEVRQMNKTADEMFEELGYMKDTFDEFGTDKIIYINNNKDHILVRKNGHYMKYNYYNFHSDFDYNDINFITEAEDKAIHKKIEELKCI